MIRSRRCPRPEQHQGVFRRRNSQPHTVRSPQSYSALLVVSFSSLFSQLSRSLPLDTSSPPLTNNLAACTSRTWTFVSLTDYTLLCLLTFSQLSRHSRSSSEGPTFALRLFSLLYHPASSNAQARRRKKKIKKESHSSQLLSRAPAPPFSCPLGTFSLEISSLSRAGLHLPLIGRLSLSSIFRLSCVALASLIYFSPQNIFLAGRKQNHLDDRFIWLSRSFSFSLLHQTLW